MIYLLAARNENLCKIGYAGNVARRFAIAKTFCPFELELITVRDGCRALEFSIHRAANDFHVRGEWFRFEKDIISIFNESQISTLQIARENFSMSNSHKFTPTDVEAAALKARLPLNTFIKQAGVSPSAFYRWRNQEHALRPLTLAKLSDAVEAV